VGTDNPKLALIKEYRRRIAELKIRVADYPEDPISGELMLEVLLLKSDIEKFKNDSGATRK